MNCRKGVDDLGIFYTDIAVGRDGEGDFEAVTALVDTGAVYSMLPAKLLRKMKIAPTIEREFTLADGRRQKLPVGDVWVRIGSEEHYSPVVFGPDDRFLLGAVTLQIFGLIADTTHHKLIPAPEFTL